MARNLVLVCVCVRACSARAWLCDCFTTCANRVHRLEPTSRRWNQTRLEFLASIVSIMFSDSFFFKWPRSSFSSRGPLGAKLSLFPLSKLLFSSFYCPFYLHLHLILTSTSKYAANKSRLFFFFIIFLKERFLNQQNIWKVAADGSWLVPLTNQISSLTLLQLVFLFLILKSAELLLQHVI